MLHFFFSFSMLGLLTSDLAFVFSSSSVDSLEVMFGLELDELEELVDV